MIIILIISRGQSLNQLRRYVTDSWEATVPLKFSRDLLLIGSLILDAGENEFVDCPFEEHFVCFTVWGSSACEWGHFSFDLGWFHQSDPLYKIK